MSHASTCTRITCTRITSTRITCARITCTRITFTRITCTRIYVDNRLAEKAHAYLPHIAEDLFLCLFK